MNGARVTDPITSHLAAAWVVDGIGCWVWQRATDGKGYGTLGVRRSKGVWATVKAHRYVYEQLVGPIPAGYQLDHLCRNRACVNPQHLEPVSNRENGLRGFGVSGLNARKKYCPVGHPLEGDNVRNKSPHPDRPWRECKTCEREMQYQRARKRRENLASAAFECGLCADRFATQRGLSVHMSKYHAKRAGSPARVWCVTDAGIEAGRE